MRRWWNLAAVLPLCAVSTVAASGELAGPVAQWSFEDVTDGQVHDSVGNIDDVLQGLYRRVPGVAGQALRFDGYTTSIVRSAAKALAVADALSVEAWVAVNTYPWNWVPIVDQRRGNDAGYLVGIDSFGHLGMQARVGDTWQALASSVPIPLKKWTHVAATFDRQRGMRLYVNGRPVGERAMQGRIKAAQDQSLIIGRVREAVLPAQWLHPKHAVVYSFDGVIDELKIFGRTLSAAEVGQSLARIKLPAADPLSFPALPSGPPGPGRFGAFYATLKYEELWDAPRRVGPRSDIVVRFDESPIRLVFWQGTNYIPAWVTENGKWYSDEFIETGGTCPPGQDCEPMSDQQVRYARVRILESTAARAVVHFRYNLCDVVSYQGADPDPLTGWTDWGDEYYTIYPDGIAARKEVAWTTHPSAFHEFQETIVINPPGTRPEDNIATDALTLLNMQGEAATYSWDRHPTKIDRPERPNIQVVNLKSIWKPFQIVPDLHPKGDIYHGERTYSMFEWWNHWPVAQIASSGISAVAPDKPSHSSLSHIEGEPITQTGNTVTKIMLHGLTNQPPAALVALAKSWLHAPALQVTAGEFTSEGYDRAQRAFVLSRTASGPAGGVHFSLDASVDSPVLNPAFVVKNWGEDQARLTVDGQVMLPGGDVRYGRVDSLEGSDLVVWVKLQSTQPTRFELESGE